MNCEVGNGHLLRNWSKNKQRYLYFQETANDEVYVFNNAHARGSKLYFMFNVIPTVVEDSWMFAETLQQ